LVPGAGLEPARTLPSPQDFKSRNYKYYPTVTDNKALYRRAFPYRYGAFVFLTAEQFGYSVSYSETFFAVGCERSNPSDKFWYEVKCEEIS